VSERELEPERVCERKGGGEGEMERAGKSSSCSIEVLHYEWQ